MSGPMTSSRIAPAMVASTGCDEFTHECLAIRVARKFKTIDVIDVLSDLFILRGHSRSHPVRQRTGVARQGGAGLDRGCRCQDACIGARHRSSSRVGDATTTRSGPRLNRIQATSTRGVRARIRPVAGCATPTGSAGHAGATANLKLTFHLDHSEGG